MKLKDHPRPWELTFSGIKSRCGDPKHDYFLRGIKVLITKEELKTIWFRDKGYLLKRPSIDRIDNDGHYSYENCQYIELVDNIRKERQSTPAKIEAAMKNLIKARSAPNWGKVHPHAKLSMEKARKIRKLLKDKSLVEIAKMYSVNPKTIAFIRDGVFYKEVKDE